MKSLKEDGFTLIEILAAIMILAASLTILLGTQTNYVDAYIREENSTKAALYASYLMTFIEIQGEGIEEGTESGPLGTRLEQLGYFDETIRGEDTQLAGWSYLIETKPLDLDLPFGGEGVNDRLELLLNRLKQVELKIYFSEEKNQHYALVYYALAKIGQS